jgi:hypothetical protein
MLGDFDKGYDVFEGPRESSLKLADYFKDRGRYVRFRMSFQWLFAWSMFKGKAYKYMMLAKSLAKDAVLNSGAEQEQWVIKAIYKLVPGACVVPESLMKVVVHHLYHAAKDKLDNGKLDNSIV